MKFEEKILCTHKKIGLGRPQTEVAINNKIAALVELAFKAFIDVSYRKIYEALSDMSIINKAPNSIESIIRCKYRWLLQCRKICGQRASKRGDKKGAELYRHRRCGRCRQCKGDHFVPDARQLKELGWYKNGVPFPNEYKNFIKKLEAHVNIKESKYCGKHPWDTLAASSEIRLPRSPYTRFDLPACLSLGPPLSGEELPSIPVMKHDLIEQTYWSRVKQWQERLALPEDGK